ncbi:MAG: ubiquinone/menaquinone biosynthesis methyltransferase [Chloroflexi bacterium]|nr:MAG: ubiquinone/menaquinone biosynthesis methyltransferase [Chloroflexota bacterium]
MVINKNNHSENAAEFNTQQDDVFGRIASRYDLLCDLFSFGIHRLWKRRVARVIAKEPWSRLLDCATGTGDIILRVLKHKNLQDGEKIIASDISPQMLAIAQQRLITANSSVEFRVLDAHSMPSLPPESVDLYSMSLGLKICQRKKVLREALRVLRPGGRLVVLESSNIPWGWLYRIYRLYMNWCVPVIGWIATRGDASAYKYLLKGMENFPSAEDFAQELASLGFRDISFERLSLGIVAIHIARKPESTESHSHRRA